MKIADTLTPATLAVFIAYAEDAPNWSGTPWVSAGNVECTKATRGNLSDLVQKGLIVIDESYGDTFIRFTSAGLDLAAECGIQV
jgi:hypothetical protein